MSVLSIDSTDMRNMKVNATRSRTFTLKSVLAEDVSNDDVNTAARSIFWIKTHSAFIFQKSKLWVSRHFFDATAVLIYVLARGFGWRGWHILQSSTWRKAIKIRRPVFESGTWGNKTLAFPRLLMWLFCPIKLCRLVISNKTFCWSKKTPAKVKPRLRPPRGRGIQFMEHTSGHLFPSVIHGKVKEHFPPRHLLRSPRPDLWPPSICITLCSSTRLTFTCSSNHRLSICTPPPPSSAQSSSLATAPDWH